MQKLNDIKTVIKTLEHDILNDAESLLYLMDKFGFKIKPNLEDFIVARKVLLWVVESQQRKKKDDNSKKLEDFNIENPVKDVK